MRYYLVLGLKITESTLLCGTIYGLVCADQGGLTIESTDETEKILNERLIFTLLTLYF